MTEGILWVVCIVLAILCAALLIRAHILKKQLRVMKAELPLTRDKSYNRQLTVELVDKDLTTLAAEMNKNLDYQKQLKLTSEQTERIMKQSVSDIAHDLRTPLTVIKGNLQMLQSTEQLSAKGSEYLRICTERSDMMKQMADDFFELAVLESDSSTPQLSRTDLTAALIEFILDNEAVVTSAGFTPDIQLPEKSVFAMAEPSMLSRMLSNLLNNILKHAQGRFAIRLSETESGCVICFENELRPDIRPDPQRLFERTYRADSSRNGGGAGLGLYIVKLLAQKMDAETSAEVVNNALAVRIYFNTLSSNVETAQK